MCGIYRYFRTLNIVIIPITLLHLLTPATAAEVELQFQEKWGTVFAEQEVKFHVSLSSTEGITGRLTWRLAAGHRTVQRGEIHSFSVTPARPETHVISLRMPPVKPGATLDLALTAAFSDRQSGRQFAEAQKDIYVFPDDPFYRRRQWMEKYDIHLFDPENTTAEIFHQADVAFTRVDNLDMLEVLEDAMLIIGEGVSFEHYRALPELMYNHAAAGAPVICLAPAEGELPLPDAAHGPSLASFFLRRSDIIAELDKRLDAHAWPDDGRVSASALMLKGRRDGVIADIVKDRRAWPWMEMEFEGGGHLIVCGFAVMEKWEKSPTPRYFLAEILARCE